MVADGAGAVDLGGTRIEVRVIGQHSTAVPLAYSEAAAVEEQSGRTVRPDVVSGYGIRRIHIIGDVENGTCFVEWLAEGTYSGAIEGISAATEKESFGGVSVLKIEGGQIVESRVYRNAPTGEKLMYLKAMDQ